MNKIIILIVAFLIVAGGVLGYIFYKKPTQNLKQVEVPEEETYIYTTTISDNFNSCSSDADCVKTQAGPCSCNSGGSAIAVNKNKSEEWETLLSSKNAMCIQMISSDWTCKSSTQTRCIDNICQLVGEEAASDSTIESF